MARYVRQALGFDLGGVDNRGAGGGPMKHNPEPATFTDYVLLIAGLGLGLAWAF
jgi:hypothetical protein